MRVRNAGWNFQSEWLKCTQHGINFDERQFSSLVRASFNEA
jgi:hypothetical protein